MDKEEPRPLPLTVLCEAATACVIRLLTGERGEQCSSGWAGFRMAVDCCRLCLAGERVGKDTMFTEGSLSLIRCERVVSRPC